MPLSACSVRTQHICICKRRTDKKFLVQVKQWEINIWKDNGGFVSVVEDIQPSEKPFPESTQAYREEKVHHKVQSIY